MPVDLSLVVLAWNNVELTQRCVDSLRDGTRSACEIVIVDNGSEPEAARYAQTAADIPVLHTENLGFAAGMNSGLAAASGDVVAFINNDTRFPTDWDVPVVEHFESGSTGIVVPAVTAAGNPVTVRKAPGDEVIRLLPFGEFPSGVVYLLSRRTILDLGGWNEAYPVASSEDLDLCFTVWANGLDVVLDTRTLVHHVGQASVRQLPARQELYSQNLELFLARWGQENAEVPRLADVPRDVHAANLARARTAVRWIERMLACRAELRDTRSRLEAAESKLDRRPDSPLRRLLRKWTS